MFEVQRISKQCMYFDNYYSCLNSYIASLQTDYSTTLGRPFAKASERLVSFVGVALNGGLKGGVGFFQLDTCKLSLTLTKLPLALIPKKFVNYIITASIVNC